MLVALGKAALAHGREVEFKDHCPHKYHTAKLWRGQIQYRADVLGLAMKTRRDGRRVFVRSTIDEVKRREVKQSK